MYIELEIKLELYNHLFRMFYIKIRNKRTRKQDNKSKILALDGLLIYSFI